jgi:hypothetical protein
MSDHLERARRALETAKIGRAMRDVSADVAAVRQALDEAKASPESIGIKDYELDGFVRDGFLSEAKNVFSAAADGCGWGEREVFFSQIVDLVTKAANVGRMTDDETVRRLRESDPCAGLPVATREQTSLIYAELDVDALDFSSFDRDEAPEAEASFSDDDWPEVTVVVSADESLMSILGDEAEPIGDDDVIDVQEAWLEDGMLTVRRGPPPLPKPDPEDLLTDDVAGPHLPAAADAFDEGFDRAERQWFSRFS